MYGTSNFDYCYKSAIMEREKTKCRDFFFKLTIKQIKKERKKEERKKKKKKKGGQVTRLLATYSQEASHILFNTPPPSPLHLPPSSPPLSSLSLSLGVGGGVDWARERTEQHYLLAVEKKVN